VGPLEGIRVLEIASIGPGPFACMMLADMGADVLRVARPEPSWPLGGPAPDTVGRGRPTIAIDLKAPAGVERVLALAERADALIEGFRPGVMERLGLGPDEVLARNPRIVYGRMTGYGQHGPLAHAPGHDINYIALAGALGAIARRGERPLFPLNLLGDYGGGGMLLAFGVVCALLEARSSGAGQVIDATMVDGAALLTTVFHGLRAGGLWSDQPGTNVLDSGAHFYEVYETADGAHIAVGALEPHLYEALLVALGIEPSEMPQWERARWPEFKARLAEVFRRRTRAQWAALLESSDACLTPVLGLGEAPEHPHNRARATFVEHDGVLQPAPAPRFSRTPGAIRAVDSAHAAAVWGLSGGELEPQADARQTEPTRAEARREAHRTQPRRAQPPEACRKPHGTQPPAHPR
jgi:alpha-methylacyl-CoA racemase